jgi:acyl dehydratase
MAPRRRSHPVRLVAPSAVNVALSATSIRERSRSIRDRSELASKPRAVSLDASASSRSKPAPFVMTQTYGGGGTTKLGDTQHCGAIYGSVMDDLPPPPHQGFLFHEQPVGRRWSTTRRTISETDLIVYATQFGFNEELFLDETAAERSGFAGRLVPGSLVMTIAEGLVISGGSIWGTGVAYLGADVQVKGPTYVGDTLQVVVEVTEARMTSRGDRGVVTTRNDVFNHTGDIVMVYTPARMILAERPGD